MNRVCGDDSSSSPRAKNQVRFRTTEPSFPLFAQSSSGGDARSVSGVDMRRHAGWAAAQTAPPTENDIIVSSGWAGAEHDTHDYRRRWHGNLLVGLSVGHYWTDHLKTESRQAGITLRNTKSTRRSSVRVVTHTRFSDRAPVGVAIVQVRPQRVGFICRHRRRRCAPPTSAQAPAQSRTVFVQNRNVPVDIPGQASGRRWSSHRPC